MNSVLKFRHRHRNKYRCKHINTNTHIYISILSPREPETGPPQQEWAQLAHKSYFLNAIHHKKEPEILGEVINSRAGAGQVQH